MIEHKIAVAGAGNMGAGIAQKYASCGFKVTLIDNNENSLKKAQENIHKTLHEAVKKNIFKEEKIKEILSAIEFSLDLSSAKPCKMVIEAIFEDIDSKKDLFKQLENIVDKDCILATNTSSFLVKDLQKDLQYPQRVLGLHYFYHPAKNRLVEIIGTHLTHESYIHTANKFQSLINKIAIFSKDSPGFIVNRFFVPWLNEAMLIVEEGKANIASVEKVSKEFFGIAMGPFELMNVTGPMIAYHSCTSLANNLGNFYSPSSIINNIIEEKKSFDLAGKIDESKQDEIASRMITTVCGIAEKMVVEEKVCSFSDVDLGAKIGLLWRKGPFSLYNEHSSLIEKNFNNYKKEKKYFSSVASDNFVSFLKNNQKFTSTCIDYKIEDDVALITFNKPYSLNALDEELFCGFKEAFAWAHANESIKGIILSGRKSFMAGADLSFFHKNIQENNLRNILDFTKKVGDFFKEIENSSKPVIAAISGVALGGGLELALACKKIIAAKNCKLGFPETGIGIYPGLGGTQRTSKKLGLAKTRYLVLSGSLLNGQDAVYFGLVDYVVDEESLIEKAKEILKNDEQKKKATLADEQIDKEFSKPLNVLLSMENKTPQDKVQKALANLKQKAPLALMIADELINRSKNITLEEGLFLELSFIEKIFSSEDAKNGIKAMIQKESIQFTGK